MRATGFRRAALTRLVFYENGTLLVIGLATGIAAAAVAVIPHLVLGGASVPIAWLAILLAVVLGVGLAVGGLAVRAVLRAPLLSALREEK